MGKTPAKERQENVSHNYGEVFVDPRTGAVLAKRNWSGPARSALDIMPFVFRLHYTMGLGETGGVVIGWIALIRTLDCFVGIYLTLPPAAGSGWLALGQSVARAAADQSL